MVLFSGQLMKEAERKRIEAEQRKAEAAAKKEAAAAAAGPAAAAEAGDIVMLDDEVPAQQAQQAQQQAQEPQQQAQQQAQEPQQQAQQQDRGGAAAMDAQAAEDAAEALAGLLRAAEGGAAFVPSATWRGAVLGYCFKLGASGQGYYQDAPPQMEAFLTSTRVRLG